MLPLLKILLIEDDKSILSELTHNLSKTIDNFERTDVTLEVIECETLAKGLEHIHDDGDIQAVILSWQIRENAIANRYAQFISELKSIRLELPVYVLGDDSKGLDIVNESEDIESFFFKDDVLSDPESILGYIINDFDDRCETPFWTAYKRYVAESNDSWHTPGTVAVLVSEIPLHPRLLSVLWS